jgi:hypothetical protein
MAEIFLLSTQFVMTVGPIPLLSDRYQQFFSEEVGEAAEI